MNDEYLFKDIIIYTLVSAKGIIPSLSLFRNNLIKTIDNFCDTLENKKCNINNIDAIRRLLCFLFDTEINKCADFHKISWSSFEITNFYYDKTNNELFTKNHLEQLLHSEDTLSKNYALALMTQSLKYFPEATNYLPKKAKLNSLENKVNNLSIDR